MAAQVKLIDYLRSRSKVDCDLLDVSGTTLSSPFRAHKLIADLLLPVASTLGPFVDCTSNQASRQWLGTLYPFFKLILSRQLRITSLSNRRMKPF